MIDMESEKTYQNRNEETLTILAKVFFLPMH